MNPLKKILVVGTAPDAPLAAMYLKRNRPDFDVHLHTTPSTPDPAGECTTPFVLEQITGPLGIRNTDLYAIGKANWTLGFKMNWGAREQYVRAFDFAPTRQIDGAETFSGVLAAEEGLDDASSGASLISAGKIFPKTRANSVNLMEQITGLQLKTEPFTDLLMKGCQTVGITQTKGAIAGIEAHDGHISSIKLENGTGLTADLYLDVTGSAAELLSAVGSNERMAEGSEALCNRAWTTARHRRSEALRPYASLDTVDSGWMWRTEHDDTIGFGLAFHSDFTSEEEARADLLEKVREPIGKPVLHQWHNGHQATPWSGNVVAIGDAASFIEPLTATRLPLLILQLQCFLRLIGEVPGGPGPRGKALYHRMIHEPWQEVRDFTSIHHRLNTVCDSPDWNHAREHCGTGAHESLLQLFRSSGPNPVFENALPFAPSALGFDTWLNALIGLGVPVRNLPAIPQEDRKKWRAHLEEMRKTASHGATAATCMEAIRKQTKQPATRARSY